MLYPASMCALKISLGFLNVDVTCINAHASVVNVVTFAQHCSRHQSLDSFLSYCELCSELIYEQPRSGQRSYQGRGKKAVLLSPFAQKQTNATALTSRIMRKQGTLASLPTGPATQGLWQPSSTTSTQLLNNSQRI